MRFRPGSQLQRLLARLGVSVQTEAVILRPEDLADAGLDDDEVVLIAAKAGTMRRFVRQVRRGRPVETDPEVVREMYAELGASETARQLGIARASVYRLIERR